MVYFELFFKDVRDLKSIVLPFYQKSFAFSCSRSSSGSGTKSLVASGVNIPNKGNLSNAYFREVIANALASNIGPVVAHYSLQYERGKTKDDTYCAFLDFLKKHGSKCQEVLLVTGGQAPTKKHLETVECLERIAKESPSILKTCRLGVAFNPYFPAKAERDLEKSRLKQKLQTGIVKTVWLQFGTDLKLLIAGVKFIREVNSQVKIKGSCFLPNKAWLHRFKFRPWRGVFCSEEFLSSDVKAIEFTRKLLHSYSELDVEPLLETAVRKPAEVELVSSLFFGSGQNSQGMSKRKRDQDIEGAKAEGSALPTVKKAKKAAFAISVKKKAENAHP